MTEITAGELAGISNGIIYGKNTHAIRHWTCDSRDVLPGSAFVALKGERTDGHRYISQVIEKGAELLLIDKKHMDENIKENLPAGVTVIAVENTENAMKKMASYVLRKINPYVTGITGSVGKTTTRELLVKVLSNKYKTHAPIRSFNTVIGCSLTILSMAENTEHLVLEFGTNHPGEISEMVKLFPPKTAIITEVVPAHIGSLGSEESILKAKMEICESPRIQHVIYNSDNKMLVDAVSSLHNIKKYSVGYNGENLKIKTAEIKLETEGPELYLVYEEGKETIPLKVALFGTQHSYNVGYAYLAARIAQCERTELTKSFSGVKSISGRGVCVQNADGSWIIDESYNANPASMNVAIENVVDVNKDSEYNLIAVLGGMRELGSYTEIYHREVLKKLDKFSEVYLVGCEWENTFTSETFIPCTNVENAIEKYNKHRIEHESKRNIILIKGSNFYRLYKFVQYLTEEN